jgi:hypothetical protein
VWSWEVEGDVCGRGDAKKSLWERCSQFLAWDWCGSKFSFLHKELPPQVKVLFFASIDTHVLIIHCIRCKYVFCTIIILKIKPSGRDTKHMLIFGPLIFVLNKNHLR